MQIPLPAFAWPEECEKFTSSLTADSVWLVVPNQLRREFDFIRVNAPKL